MEEGKTGRKIHHPLGNARFYVGDLLSATLDSDSKGKGRTRKKGGKILQKSYLKEKDSCKSESDDEAGGG